MLLNKFVRMIPCADKIILLSDFNAKVGKDYESLRVAGKHEIGK